VTFSKADFDKPLDKWIAPPSRDRATPLARARRQTKCLSRRLMGVACLGTRWNERQEDSHPGVIPQGRQPMEMAISRAIEARDRYARRNLVALQDNREVDGTAISHLRWQQGTA